MPTKITRQELYQRVWGRPMVHVGADFGMSGNALRMYCVKYGIPIPGRGHWAKLKAGKKVNRVALPPRGPGLEDPIIVGKGRMRWYGPSDDRILNSPIPPAPEFHEPIEELGARVKKMVGRDRVLATLDNPHRLLKEYLMADAERRRIYESSRHPSISDAPLFDTPFEQRRLSILSGLFGALTRAHMRPYSGGERALYLGVRVGDQYVSLVLDHPDRFGKEERHYGPRDNPRDMKLRLEILPRMNIEEIQTVWEDGRGSRLERRLKAIVIAIIVAGEIQHRRSAIFGHEQHIKRKARLIEKQERAIEEARRKEKERQRQKKEALRNHLLGLSDKYRKANEIRAMSHRSFVR